jgi:uncharacterized protein (DUF779 family)
MLTSSFSVFFLTAPAFGQTTTPTNTLTVTVRNLPDGVALTQYEWLISIDNTGDPTQGRTAGCSPDNSGYPDSCDWPSIRAMSGAAPIYASGDQDDFAVGAGIDLPDGRYLISVLAPNHKLGGAHFTVPVSGTIVVDLHPDPLPAATMRIKVFEDISPVNGQIDAPAEHGLAGFRATVNDTLGQVSTDVFGNPLCTTYNAAGDVTGQTNCLVSDADGDIVIPNLGPLRYDVTVAGPNGQGWVETTTLEGSPSWDTWLAEGGTGLDNEFVVAGEPFPWTVFGFVRSTDLLNDSGVTGGVSGTLTAASVYLPQQGALPYFGDIWTGFTGTKVQGPITDGWVALSDLGNGDTARYIGRAAPNGEFLISNVPDGDYLLTWWDERLHYILDWIQVTVADGQVFDVGAPFLTGWFTEIDGYVFNDLNSNGRRDTGEPGIAGYGLVIRDRENSEIDRMSITATTDEVGHYVFEKAYPLTSWLILEAYNDNYYTTGVTYQSDNQPTATTVLGAGVDVGFLPVLGQPGRLDWGVRPYDEGTNGGIVGTVSYDTTRAELNPQFAGAEPWQPGVPGVTVNLYTAVQCGTNADVPCSPEGLELAPDGSYAKGNLLNTTTTESWEQPTGCVARDANGVPLRHGIDEQVLPTSDDARCLEGPLVGTQFQTGFASLDGNYGFGDGCFGDGGASGEGTCADGSAPTVLPQDYYLVEVDPGVDALSRPLYQVTREEDINIFDGDSYTPAVPPPACAGALHTVDVAGVGTDGAGAVSNPAFADAGGSPFEGLAKPLCNVKLVDLVDGGSIAPIFTYFTEVPIPGKWKGYIIDDLTVSTDQKSLNFGEKAGIPNSPIGIYDFSNRLVTTITSDPNGVYEVLLPSSHTVNCPSPAGVCAAMYYLLGNDPGQPGALNPNYNPQYRTIGATFEIYTGLMIPSDLAPTQIVPGVLAAGSLFGSPPQCPLPAAAPKQFAVNKPYGLVRNSTTVANRINDFITISGDSFGASPGSVRLVGASTYTLPLQPSTTWSNTQLSVVVPYSTPPGTYQLEVVTGDGQVTDPGLTYRVYARTNTAISGATVFEVGPVGTQFNPLVPAGRRFSTIQAAVTAAASIGGTERLVVVYPGATAQWNPTGAYFENVILHAPVRLQGVGSGGFRSDNSYVRGSVIDGRGVAGDTDYAETWREFFVGLTYAGQQAIYEGAVISVVAPANGGQSWTSTRFGAIDGFTITGGDQQGFPNEALPVPPTVHEISSVQGGGIWVNGYARYLKITNNVISSNGGTYGSAIRVGTPNLPAAIRDAQNDFVRIAHNRILANGGTNLAGAIGIFSGAEGYEIASNEICGNFSAEYGGGISHYGFSPNGKIHHNRVLFNRSYDEGGGIFIAGELPANPASLSPGAGAVQIYQNLVQNNLANDDGGGIRFLQAGNFVFDVHDNMIVNNVSTHEGGGVSLNDAPQVRFYNNTVMKNITTASAVTSLGYPAPAGLSTSANSDQLQATLPSGSPLFSNPLLFNNVFWDNRAGTFTGATVAGIGLTGDPNPVNHWDMGVTGVPGLLSPTNSLLQTILGTTPSPTNVVGSDPLVAAEYDSSVSVVPWRGNPRFVDILMVTLTEGPYIGDYHLRASSPAINIGAASKNGVAGSVSDFDGDARPIGVAIDAGADERRLP